MRELPTGTPWSASTPVSSLFIHPEPRCEPPEQGDEDGKERECGEDDNADAHGTARAHPRGDDTGPEREEGVDPARDDDREEPVGRAWVLVHTRTACRSGMGLRSVRNGR